MDLIFHKTEYEYYTNIDIDGDDSRMILDTGSPVTTISIPSLLQITGEPMFAFRKKQMLLCRIMKRYLLDLMVHTKMTRMILYLIWLRTLE